MRPVVAARPHHGIVLALVVACAAPAGAPAPSSTASGPSGSISSSGATHSGPTASAETAAGETAGHVRDLEAGALPAGHYTASRFAVPFSFTVSDSGWGAQWATPHLVNIGMVALSSELQFYAVYEVHARGAQDDVVPSPDSFMEVLRSTPGLEIVSTTPIAVGGVAGECVRMRPTAASEVFLVPPPDRDEPRSQPYGISLNPGDGLDFPTLDCGTHLVFDEVTGGPLVITYYTAHEEFIGTIEKLLETVEFAER